MAAKVIEVVMHDLLRPDFQKWLAARGLELQRTPFLDADEPEALECWTVMPAQGRHDGRV